MVLRSNPTTQVALRLLAYALFFTVSIVPTFAIAEIVYVDLGKGKTTACSHIDGSWIAGSVDSEGVFQSYSDQIEELKQLNRTASGKELSAIRNSLSELKALRRKATEACANLTRTPIPTPTPVFTATRVATSTPFATVTPTSTPVATATLTPRATATATSRPTTTPTSQPSATATPRPTNTPGVPSADGNAHFDSLLKSPYLHAAMSLRSQSEIDSHSQLSRYVTSNPAIRYDPSFDAAKVTIRPGDGDIEIESQLILPFGAVLRGDGTSEISFQWEGRWSSSYVGCAADGLMAQKFVRLYQATTPGVSAARRFEIQNRFAGNTESAGYALFPGLRTYTYDVTGETGGQYLPGGSEDPFHIVYDSWVRYTFSVVYADTNGDGKLEQRVRMWVADEFRDPVLVVADLHDPSKGYLAEASDERIAEYGADTHGLSYLRLVLDSSQSREGDLTTPPLESWVRNFVVFKNQTVPLGGRPVR